MNPDCRSIQRLLVANRGEIACRVMRSARALGIGSVAVHSDIDRHARHVAEADIAVDLGGAKPADSYLRGDRIIAAALASGAQAIHPGYGFLSRTPTSPAPARKPACSSSDRRRRPSTPWAASRPPRR